MTCKISGYSSISIAYDACCLGARVTDRNYNFDDYLTTCLNAHRLLGQNEIRLSRRLGSS